MEAAVVHPDWVRLTNLRHAMLWKHDLPDTAYLPVPLPGGEGWEQEPRNVALKVQLHDENIVCCVPERQNHRLLLPDELHGDSLLIT